jgi:transcriptional regulator with XRE-family HTH domain
LPGNNIRRYRLEQKLSLRELGVRAGVSASLISQVENGRIDPSISSLRRIAEALDVSIFYLLEDGSEPRRGAPIERAVVRVDHRRRVLLPDSGLEYELLCPDVDRSMEVWIGHLAPGSATGESRRGHSGEELMLVVSGRMEVEYGADTTVLDRGDSIYLDGTIPHRMRALGDEPLIFMSALTPPVL